jgi:Short C-terminal domain
MPGLLRGVARTAAIAGTATAVSNRVSRRQARRRSEQGGYVPGRMAYAAPPRQQESDESEPAAAPEPDPIEQLKQLGELHAQGILTDEEFAAQKAKLLN